MMDIEFIAKSFFSNTAALACVIIALAGSSLLSSPISTIVGNPPPSPSWVSLTDKVFRPPFPIALCITKIMFLFSLSVSHPLSSDWFTAIGTWFASFGSLLNNILPAQFSAADSRAGFYIGAQRRAGDKILATYNAFLFDCPARVAEKGIGFASKRLPTLFTDALRVLNLSHFSLPFEKLSRFVSWGIQTGLDSSAVHEAALAPLIIYQGD